MFENISYQEVHANAHSYFGEQKKDRRGSQNSYLDSDVVQNQQLCNEGASGGKGDEMLKCDRRTDGQIKRQTLTDLKIEIAIQIVSFNQFPQFKGRK